MFKIEKLDTTGFRFTNHFGTEDLYLGFDGSESGIQGRLLFTTAYLAATAEEESYSLDQAWNSEEGLLLLLGEPVQNPAQFVDDVRSLTLQTSTRLLWIANPSDEVSSWSTTEFELGPAEANHRILNKPALLWLTGDPLGYLLSIDAGCLFDIDTDTSTLRIRGDQAPGEKVSFGRGDRLLELSSSALDIDLHTSPGATFTFDFEIPGAAALVSWFDDLDVGMRYAYPIKNDGMGSVRFPVFSEHPALPELAVSARLMVSELTNGSSSYLRARFDEPTNFTSWFRTVAGRACLLKTSEISLLFAWSPTQKAPARPERLTLVPQADFDVSISAQVVSSESTSSPHDHELLCGSSGAEYIRLPEGGSEYRLQLVPGMPAFAAGDAQPLGDEATTAWVRFSSQVSELEYYAQPEGDATMFDATNSRGSEAVPMLPYFPVIAAQIPMGDGAEILPWVALAGLSDDDADQGRRLEINAISPARKDQLSVARVAFLATGGDVPLLPDAARFDDESKLTAITPRGLEAEFTQPEGGGPEWTAVQIARLLTPHQGQLRFSGENGIAEPLLSALLTNQQFLVISNPAAILPFFSVEDETKIRLAGWEFLLHPDTWAAHGTILIIKNADAALGDLITDTGSWTSGSEFNRSISSTSRALQKIVEEAEHRVAEKRELRSAAVGPAEGIASDFEYFVDVVVRSPTWNGFLFLNASIGELPDDLAGLRAGIKESQFFAHHLGVTQTLFKSIDELQATSSSMFGLILYEDRSARFGGGLDYAFRVEELDVLFRNSAIRDFRSEIALYVARLFGQLPTRPDAPQPDIRMEGVHQRRGDEDTYMFSTSEDLLFDLGSGPLQQVTILQGEFETLSVDPSLDGSTCARFSFVGFLNFADVSPDSGASGLFDVFSFDELGFSQLAIDMSFENQKPRSPSFEFSIAPSQLIEAKSDARSGSFYEGFPMKLGSLVGSTDSAPGGLGFMTVDLPVEQTSLPKQWFGIELQLDMGTLSDVAGSAGLEASILLAWGRKPDQFLVGLKLPGSSGASAELSLLGVLKLKMYSLELRRSEKAWALLMNGMTLKVFSKELPPNGSFDFYLFGNPDPTGSSNSLGWYGAYLKNEEKKKEVQGPPGLSWPAVTGLQRLDNDTATDSPTIRNRLPPTVRRRLPRSSTPLPGA